MICQIANVHPLRIFALGLSCFIGVILLIFGNVPKDIPCFRGCIPCELSKSQAGYGCEFLKLGGRIPKDREFQFLANGPGLITGRISENNSAVMSCRIWLCLNGYLWTPSTTTDINGKYTFRVPYGEYKLTGYALKVPDRRSRYSAVSTDNDAKSVLNDQSLQIMNDIFIDSCINVTKSAIAKGPEIHLVAKTSVPR